MIDNERQKTEIKNLQAELKALRTKQEGLLASNKSIFTEGQLRKLITWGNLHWKWEETKDQLPIGYEGKQNNNKVNYSKKI